MEQFNLFEEIEREERDNAQIKRVQDEYRLWKTLPDIIPYKKEYAYKHWAVDTSPIHLCDGLPKEYDIWLNTCECNKGGEFWVFNKGKIGGELISECPYCHANLAKGEGSRFLRKWERGYSFYQERTVRSYYKLDAIDLMEGA